MTKTAAGRRLCKIDGCAKIVKSQGLCQRHGAKTRLCKMKGCTKQAQGNFDGMCKSHFKESRVDLKETIPVIPKSAKPPNPVGQSVYDTILPASLAFQPSPGAVMPLVAHLKRGFDENRPRGWHRNDERRARGLWPVTKAAMQLQGWERELVWMEICILSGNNQASFRHLARAWGRDKGFHMVLAQFICERRGNVERKKRPRGKGGPKRDDSAEDFMEDILSFEDMDLPIEMLDAFAQNSDGDSEQEGEQEEAMEHFQVMEDAQVGNPVAMHAHHVHSLKEEQQDHHHEAGFIDPLDEHLLMPLESNVMEEPLAMRQVPDQQILGHVYSNAQGESTVIQMAQV